MPVNCADFLKKAKTKKVPFALLGKGTAWKFYTDGEVGSLLNKPQEDKQLFTGLAAWSSNKCKFVMDGDKDDAKKAMKAAYTAEKIKWEDTGITIVGSNEDAGATGTGTTPSSTGTSTTPSSTGGQPTTSTTGPTAESILGKPVPKLPDVPSTPRQSTAADILGKPVPNLPDVPSTPEQTNAGQQQETPRPQRPKRPNPQTEADQAAAFEYQRFKTRMQTLMPEIALIRSTNEPLAKKATEAMSLAKTSPAAAQRLLDAVTSELTRDGQKDQWLRLARQFRLDWEEISGGALVKDPVLLERRKAFEAELSSKKDYKAATKALERLQTIQQSKKKIRQAVIHNWNPGTRRETCIARIAAILKVSEDRVPALVDTALEEMRAESADLRPEGFELDADSSQFGLNVANPSVPAGSRPRLSIDEAKAVLLYSRGTGPNPDDPSQTKSDFAPFKLMNRALWTGKEPDPPYDADYKQLQAAFAKTKPFPKPVTVARGMNFDTKEKLEQFLKPFKESVGKDTLVPLTGFISTCSGGVPAHFGGNIKFSIVAKQGLDLSPYSESPWEAEVLLNHNTLVKVLKIKEKKKIWEVFVEQILPKGGS